MAEGEVRQYWVRNDRGTMWGPLTLPTIELLLESGAIQGRIQMSGDGLNFAFPWRFPEAREVIPHELWGPGAPPPSASELGASSPAIHGATAPGGARPSAAPMPGIPPTAGPGAAPMAGPGVVPTAGPGAAPFAGPGVVPTAGPRAAPFAGPGVVPAAGPGAAPMAGPGVRAMAGPGAVPTSGPGAAPMAGPGVRPMAGPGAAPMAGPGARATVDPARRPVAPATPQVRPPGAVQPPTVAGPARAPGAPVVAASPAAAPAPVPVAVPAVEGDDTAPEIPARGPLEQYSPIRLFGRIAAREQTGLLTLSLADRAIQIHFRKGNPEFVDSTHPEEALGPSLMAGKLLTPQQLQQAMPSLERFGGDLLTALFGLGLLQPATAFSFLAQRAGSILSRGLKAEAGTFTFELRELPANKAMPLGNRWAVLSDTVRRIPSADLKRRLTPVLQLPIMKSGGVVAASELRLTPHEVRALTVIDGVRSIAQLLTDFAQDADHLLRLAFLLKELDAVSFAGQSRTAVGTPPPVEPPPAPAQAPVGAGVAGSHVAGAPRPAGAAARPAGGPPVVGPAAPAAQRPPAGAVPNAGPSAPRPVPTAGPGATGTRPPAAGPGAVRAPAAAQRPTAPVASPGATATGTSANAPGADEIPALRQLSVAMKQQNHFQRLGLTEQTNSSAVKVAYFRLAKLYHPDTLPQGAPPELEKLKAEVFGYIGDAYRTLSDDKSRASYIEELKSGGSGDGVDINSILMAEELFQKSCILVKARKFADAVKMLDEAIKLNPEEAEFYAWRGYARFFTAADKKAAQPEAFREIHNAIKRNERCAPAHYFLGVIAKLSGDAAGALKHFKRTVELQPDHIDAQREIRMASQRK